ncbi:MAG TPA: Fur family transcriptional regulator [Candidatus Cloacimonadota bacterium]|jgi:Fur family ferric uptake transcriptional regulator|nr:Fur family transcriptional regulator [Candidatus Cloacimonadota bacterium]
MQAHLDVFRRCLESRGLKLTHSRKSILEAAFDLHEHFDAEQLYDNLKGSGISLATVYRTIPLLLDAGLIQHALRVAGRDRYEHIYGHPKHIHWVCRKCGAMVETALDLINPSLYTQAASLKFSLEEVNCSLSGLCWKCQKDENESQ